MRAAMIALSLLCLAVPAMAQQSAPPAAAPAPAAAPMAAPATGSEARKPSACQVKGRQQGLRGAQLRDFAQVCQLESRLTCLKDAIARKVEGPARKEFLRTCEG